MANDIDSLLQQWEYRPGELQARIVEAGDGREVIQMRIDLGVMQIEPTGRPDGERPSGFATYFDYLLEKADQAARSEVEFQLTEEQCQEADREFVQFYHRRICWLSLEKYHRAVSDADHTLAFMDFVRDHSPDEQYVQAHEQYRGFVLFQRTQAAAAAKLNQENPESAIDEIHSGLNKLQDFFEAFGVDSEMDEHPMVQHLRRIEDSVREEHGITATLREQLAAAVEAERYEEAARLRDVMERKGRN